MICQHTTRRSADCVRILDTSCIHEASNLFGDILEYLQRNIGFVKILTDSFNKKLQAGSTSQLQVVMASHVVVIDSSARRTLIKTTPGKFLSDVLQEACIKLGLDASTYGLKYVDLSLSRSA